MTQQIINTLSPAKINLMLRILGQRTDGYHLLQTYFQLLDWGDDLSFRTTSEDDIDVEGNFHDLPLEKNLIYQAIKLLEPHRQNSHGIHVSVTKRIPQGSGLGGGSSNAGVTLNAINDLWKCQRTKKQLQAMALTLGADVPVFVANQSAMAYGIGEQLFPYSIKKHHFVLIFPQVNISTVQVFGSTSLKRNDEHMAEHLIQDKKHWTNTCLPVVLAQFPEVADIYHNASKLSPIHLSGTGSTLFASFEEKTDAQQFIRRCPHHWKTQLTQSRII